ncbi:MAG: DUF3037 domain-containing protein [Chlorobi bacterium CHB2]|nr:DUF3037 domain-containing protein [Chlorobi bacterium CHB2]
MNTDMQPAKGYYSIVQYVPDVERTEGANIGIVLFCPDKHFLQAKLSPNNNRVNRFFGSKPDSNLDGTRIKTLKMAFQERMVFEKGRIKTQEDFRLFGASRGNHLLLTEPRPIKVLNPEEELNQLFNRLVRSNSNRKQNDDTKHLIKEIDKQFESEISKQGIAQLIKKNVLLELPLLKRSEVFPFSFQNGQQNVIKTFAIRSNDQKNTNQACVLAMEGKALADINVKLNVLAKYDAVEDDHVPNIFASMDIPVHTVDRIEEFVLEIKKSAH